jgi:hypothetical protein
MTKSKGSVLFLSSFVCFGALLAPASRASASYEMESYANWPGGSEIAAGDYDSAIARAASGALRMDAATALVAATNLCVAYTVKRDLAPAAAACERALALARRADTAAGARLVRGMATAKALTNRGVLRAVSGDRGGAAADFRKAAELRGSSAAPERNLAYLESLPADRLAATAD